MNKKNSLSIIFDNNSEKINSIEKLIKKTQEIAKELSDTHLYRSS
jgi:hypothetical protein